MEITNRICPFCGKGNVWRLEPFERTNQNELYCLSCGVRFADGFVNMKTKDKAPSMMHTVCLRCGRPAVSVPFGLDGLPYTNYSYCEDCLREGLKLLKEREPKKGKWLPKKASIYPYGYDVQCSECGFTMGSTFGYKYCPKCGTKMETDGDE